MPDRPLTFNDIIGHPNLNEFFLNHLSGDTLPQFLILEGEEGLGKTSFAKLLAMGICCESTHSRPCYSCPSCREISEQVIQNNRSTESVRLYNMSIDGGKDAARDVVSHLTLGLSGLSHKVVILDEAHGMTAAAQDAFLVNTEYLPKGVHMILATTNTSNLSATLKSRALSIRLNKIKQSDIVLILRREVEKRGLTIQGGDATLNLIAQWANGKPRIALNLLGGFAPNSSVSAATIKEFIGFMDIDEVTPLLTYLGGSMTHGIAYISEMKISDSLIDIIIETLRIKKDQASYKLSRDDAIKLRRATASVSEESLVKFIYELSALPKLTTTGVIAAFIRAHDSFENLFKENTGVLNDELRQKSQQAPPEIKQTQQRMAPTLDALLKLGSVIKEG